MTPTVKIHFVCSGNIFRSRLAEAYAKSLDIQGWEISSSGIVAETYPDAFLSPWAKILARQNHITDMLHDTRTQTTSRHLQDSDLIIFVNTDVYEKALKLYDFNKDSCVVWDIKDRGDWHVKLRLSQRRKRTFKHIKSRVDHLVRDITHGGWTDIVSESNEPLHFKLPVSIANQKGLWHRGCHALLTTPNGHTLIQKRSKHIFFSPNLIDVTLGGHVDAGEEPVQATIREIQEETGLQVNPSSLKFLEIHKWNSYHPRYKTHTKVFIYTYHVRLPSNNPVLVIQKKEVALMTALSPQEITQLLLSHRLKNIGKLNYTYAFYSRIVQLARFLPTAK